jgi:O-antigen ligase
VNVFVPALTLPASFTPYRAWLFVLIALLSLVAWSYLNADLPRSLIISFMAVPFTLGMLAPAVGVAAVLGLAPLVDGIASLFLHGTLALHHQGRIFWIEPVFLGVWGGLLVRLAWNDTQAPAGHPAGRFYLAAISTSLGLALLYNWGNWLEWPSLFFTFLTMTWQLLPFMDQLAPEHVLRASLLLLSVPAWIWLVKCAVTTSQEVRLVWLAWLGGACATAGYGIWMWIHRHGRFWPRMESLFEDVNSYGSYLILTLAVAGAIFIGERHRLLKGMAILTLLLTAVMIFLTGSRVALVVFLVVSITLTYLSIERRRLPLIAGAAIVLLTITLALTSWGLKTTGKGYEWRRLQQLTVQIANPEFLVEHFQQYRQTVWLAAIRAFLERPLFGMGPGLLYQNLGRYQTTGDIGWQPAFENAHNYFLQLAAEVGIMGLFGFLWLVWVSLRSALMDTRPEGLPHRALAIGALGYLATAITGHPLLLPRQLVLFWGFIGVLAASSSLLDPAASTPGRLTRFSAWAVIPLFFVALWWQPVTQPCSSPAPSAEPISWHFASGFYGSEGIPPNIWRWMKKAGEVRFCNGTDKEFVASLTFRIASFAAPRQLTLYTHGQHVADLAVPTTIANFTLPTFRFPPGLTTVLFSTSPGPFRVDPILHNSDPRTVSVQFFEPTISLRSP